MKAQMLYVLQELTGFVTKRDLERLFTGLTGRSAPTGDFEFPRNLLELNEDGWDALHLLNSTTIDVLRHYVPKHHEGITGEKDPFRILVMLRDIYESPLPLKPGFDYNALFLKNFESALPELSELIGLTRGFEWHPQLKLD